MRSQQHPEDRSGNEPVEPGTSDGPRRRSDVNAVDLAQAQQKAERTLLEAEKFKAQVKPPGLLNNFIPNMGESLNICRLLDQRQVVGQNGMMDQSGNPQVGIQIEHDLEQLTGANRINDQGNMLQKLPQVTQSMNIMDIGSGVSDDDFCLLTCHIEPSLIHKIEKGEFVELEKLLPKDKFGKNDEGRMEWVHRDGGTYLVPAHKDTKINGFRRWEQAFRAYAMIYCGANPHRSKEIWQYITVINTAASSYTWENVYNYDITFRHLMAFNPQRSWVVTYNQMWNLSMRDPIPKNFNKGQSAFQHYSRGGFVLGKSNYGSGHNTSSNPMQVRRNKSDYCWNFNRGVPCKFGSKCKFIERCKYCDSPSHGVNACVKLQKKENTKTNTQANGKANTSGSKTD